MFTRVVAGAVFGLVAVGVVGQADAPTDKDEFKTVLLRGGETCTVRGTVTFQGKPVGKGTITFHTKQGEAIEAEIKFGEYSAENVPVGMFRLTIKAAGVPAKYADKDKTEIQFQVSRGKNVLDLELKK
jgi:hypothetical protein